MSRKAWWSYPRGAILLVAVLAWASPGYAILQSNVLVVYNTASPDGATIAQEYQEIYPGVRLLGISLPGTGEVISGQEYLDKVRAPILQSLTATTDVIVTTKGMPLRINNPYQSGLGVSQASWSAYSSLESELTRIDTVDSLKGMGWQSVLFSPNPAVANPYDLRNGSK
ncbi:MAG: hypothetical protein NTV86_19100, partial [Planctomycetota bacterium]|nr:hypothetical protein [Planctomycetota bacterium]